MWKKIIKIILVLILSALVSFAIARLGGSPFGHHYKFVANLLFGFFITIFLRKKDRGLFLAAIFPTIALSVFIHLFDVGLSFFELAVPSTLAFFVGLLLGWLFLQNKRLKVITSLMVVGLISVSEVSYKYWVHKLNYDTFFGEVNIALTEEDSLSFIDENGLLVSLESNKPIVLYFWDNYCGVCMETIPVFDQLNLEYQDVADFYLVNVIGKRNFPNIKKQKEITASRLKKAEVKHTTNLYFLKQSREMLKKYRVEAYPTILIIENNQIKFIGDTMTLKRAIKKALKE